MRGARSGATGVTGAAGAGISRRRPGAEGRRASLRTAARAADILFMAPRPARRPPLAPGQPDRRTSPRVVARVLPGRLLPEDFLGFGIAWGAPENSGPQFAGKQRDGGRWVKG